MSSAFYFKSERRSFLSASIFRNLPKTGAFGRVGDLLTISVFLSQFVHKAYIVAKIYLSINMRNIKRKQQRYGILT